MVRGFYTTRAKNIRLWAPDQTGPDRGVREKEGALMKRLKKTGLVFFPAFDWAISPSHPEREERLLYTQDQVFEEGLLDFENIVEYKPGLATIEDMNRIHLCVPDAKSVITSPTSSRRAAPSRRPTRCSQAKWTTPSPWSGLRAITRCSSSTAPAASAT